MANMELLVRTIYSKGWNKGSLAKALGKRASWLSRKLKKNNFTLGEAEAIAVVLDLTSDEAVAIFFSHNVA